MSVLVTQHSAEVIGRSSPTSRRLVVFRLAGQAYGLPLEAIQEIVSMPLLSRPPGLPPLVAGFFNLENVAVAVLRLDRLFAAPHQACGLYTPLLVLQNLGVPLALMVESVVGIISVPESSVVSIPHDSSLNECTEGVVTVDDSHVILLSPDRILLVTEQQRLAELVALEQARLAELEGGEL